MKTSFSFIALLRSFLSVTLALIAFVPDGRTAAPGPALSATFNEIPAGSVVNLTSEGAIDWVHWGLFTETSLDRKNGVVPQISDFTLVDAPSGFAFVYQFADNANGYSWTDGTPTATVNDTRTGVWAYGTPLIGSGFELTAPADSTVRTLKVFVGAYAARGKFEAFLSDGSAHGYTNTSLFNLRNGPSGAYAITYSAASPAQHLTIRWTLLMPSQPDGNVTLQSATLTAVNFNNPPFASITSPPNNASFAAGDSITITASANDTDGTVAKVEFFADDIKIGEDVTSPFSITWNNASPGLQVLTAVVSDTQGASSSSNPVEIFVHGTGGSLGGTRAGPPALPSAINLTSEGMRDWAHWGATTNALFNHKSDVAQQISNYQKIGAEAVQIFTDNYSAYSWSDGTPITQTNNLTRGVFTTGVENGFELTVPADTTTRTLKVYVGLYGAQGNFQAWLSDFSAPAFTDTTLSNFFGNAYAVYTLNFATASAGETLTIRYRALNLFDQDFGNVTLQAATLVGNSGANIPPSVAIRNPVNGRVFDAPASFSLAASASDSDGSVTQVEFFLNSSSIGIDATDPYSVPVSALAAGSYMLSAVASDNTGAKATNNITIIVNAPPTASLTSPSDGESFVAPANITLSALAGDNDGSVTNVEFFNGATFLGNDISSPYAFPWNGVAAGRYTLTVKATDNRGAATTSAAITVEVVDNLAPTVSITNPPNNTVLTAPASFALTASADDNDGNMVNVEFYNGASSLGIDSSDPYSVPITNLAAGTYLLSAVATDDGGAKATNTITLIVNALPTASITGPTNGQSFVAPANITLTALAGDSDGTVTNVQFFNGATLLGNDTSIPYAFAWNGVEAGSYSLTVKATDNRGASTTSASITISVTNSVPNAVMLLTPTWDGATFIFSFATQAGRQYEVHFIDVLGGSDWHLLTDLTGTGETFTVTNFSPSAAQRIYRIESK